MYIYICVYVRYCITIIHATEPQATSPTGNRAKGNISYRQPICIHREVPRGPWRVPGGPLDHQMLCFPMNLKSSVPGVPDANLVQLFNNRWDNRFSTIGLGPHRFAAWAKHYVSGSSNEGPRGTHCQDPGRWLCGTHFNTTRTLQKYLLLGNKSDMWIQ